MNRLLVCRVCHEQVEVYEAPRPFIDPDRYVCVACLDDRHEAVQLELQEKVAPLVEERSYDPEIAEIPY